MKKEITKELFKDLNLDFKYSRTTVISNRLQWNDFEKRTMPILQEYVSIGREMDYYEFLYAVSDYPLIKKHNLNAITFYAGQHGMGIREDKQDFNTGKTSLNIPTERSGELSFLQTPSGEVIVIVFPSSSELISQVDPYIVLKVFKRPCDIKEKYVHKAVRFYLRYLLITSYVGNPTIIDKIRIWRYKFKFSWGLLFGAFKSAGQAARTYLFIKTGGVVH
jgi:hypothetical protein